MEELTCVGCGIVLTDHEPEALVAKMAAHFDGCDAAKDLLKMADMSEVAEIVDEDALADVGGHLLVLSTPIMGRDDATGEVEIEGMSSLYFGIYDTRQEVKEAADQYLLAMAGFNCGEDDCPHEHAHTPSVLTFHTKESLAGFIADEQDHWTHQAEHLAKGESCCDECHDHDEQTG